MGHGVTSLTCMYMYTCNRNSLHKHEKGDDDLIPGLNNYNIIKIRCLLYLFPIGDTPTCNSILLSCMGHGVTSGFKFSTNQSVMSVLNFKVQR
jgi:hypothetical protein